MTHLGEQIITGISEGKGLNTGLNYCNKSPRLIVKQKLLRFLALRVQLVILVSAFMIASRV